MARRLAQAKSLAVASRFHDALIIGCDQVAVGKREVPLQTRNPARTRRVSFELCPAARRRSTRQYAYTHLRRSSASASSRAASTFRKLDDGIIERYLARDNPTTAPQSRRPRSGIALIAKIEGEDSERARRLAAGSRW